MKTPSDDLFILIKSLSSAEKRYFKIFSTIHSGKSFNKKYIILFDAIDRLKQYDEKKLKTRLKDDTLKSNLKMFKSYVSEVILNSLEKYHQNSTKQLQVNHLFAQAHILCSKRLFPLCEKVLKKAESIAESEELFPELINILFLKIEIARATEQYEKIFSTNGHKQRVSSFSNLLHNYTEYLFLGLNAEQVLKKNFLTRKNTDRIMHKQILANTLLLNSTKAKSATAKRMYFNLKSRFLMIMGQDQKAYDVILECISFYKSKNTLANQDLSFYFITLYNKAIIEFIIGQAKTAYETIHCFQEMLERYMHQLSANALVNGNDQLYTLKIGSCISTGDFKAAEKHLDEFEHSRYFNSIKDSSIKAHTFYGAIINFGLSNYSRSLKYLNKILLLPNTGIRNDIIVQSKFLIMIVQFELNDLDALPYTIRSTYRSLLKGERLYKFENAILQFLRKDLPKADHKSELIHAFKKLSGIIREISKDPFEKNAMGEFDFISWLESKIENRPFAEIIRNKVKQ